VNCHIQAWPTFLVDGQEVDLLFILVVSPPSIETHYQYAWITPAKTQTPFAILNTLPENSLFTLGTEAKAYVHFLVTQGPFFKLYLDFA
jgi:hypothetical protein